MNNSDPDMPLPFWTKFALSCCAVILFDLAVLLTLCVYRAIENLFR